MLESELRIEVLDAFFALTQSLSNLCAAVKSEPSFVAWLHEADLALPGYEQARNAREKACCVMSQLQYTASQVPREILLAPGYIGASPSTLTLATVVNECKDRFKKCILALKPAKISMSDAMLSEKMSSILHRSMTTSLTLKKAGLARLHLKQCYRKIPILNAVPQKISWTWAHTRSIKKITVSKAFELLMKKGNDPGIQIQLQKLSTLSPHESLAIIQELAPHLRANIVFNQNNLVQRKMIKGPIPIFFPCTLHTPHPEFTPPSEKHGRDINRSIRSDVRLDPNVFLPAIRAHRYALPH